MSKGWNQMLAQGCNEHGSLHVRLLGATASQQCLLGLVVCQDMSLAYFVHSLSLC